MIVNSCKWYYMITIMHSHTWQQHTYTGVNITILITIIPSSCGWLGVLVPLEGSGFLIFGCDSAHCISLWQSQGSVRYSGGAADSWYPLPPWWPVLCGVCGIYNWWFRVGITLHLFWVRFPYWLLYYMVNYHMEWRVVADWVRSFPFMEAHCLRNAVLGSVWVTMVWWVGSGFHDCVGYSSLYLN